MELYFTKFHRTFNVNGQIQETFLFTSKSGSSLKVFSDSLVAKATGENLIAHIDMDLINKNHTNANYYRGDEFGYDIPCYHIEMFENMLRDTSEYDLRYQARQLGKEMFFRTCEILVEHFKIPLDMPIYLEPLPDTNERGDFVRNANTLKLEAYYENELGFEKVDLFQNVGSDGAYRMKSNFRKILIKAKQMAFTKSRICVSCYDKKAEYHDPVAHQLFCGEKCQTKYWDVDV